MATTRALTAKEEARWVMADKQSVLRKSKEGISTWHWVTSICGLICAAAALSVELAGYGSAPSIGLLAGGVGFSITLTISHGFIIERRLAGINRSLGRIEGHLGLKGPAP